MESTTGLYQKHRPTTFAEVVGQDIAVKVLEGYLAAPVFPPVLLLSGGSGTGKTTIARILRQRLGCTEGNYQEYNAGDDRGIEFVRRLRSGMPYGPVDGARVRICLLDECHNITSAAQEALLKLLEDSPSWYKWFLCTTDPNKLKNTILTRCDKVNLVPVPVPKLRDLVGRVAEKEGWAPFPTEVADKIASKAQGSPRMALSMLSSVIELNSQQDMLDALDAGGGEESGKSLAQVLCNPDCQWSAVADAIRKVDDAESARRGVLGYANAVLLNSRNTNDARFRRALWVALEFRMHVFDSGVPGLTAAAGKVMMSSQQK